MKKQAFLALCIILFEHETVFRIASYYSEKKQDTVCSVFINQASHKLLAALMETGYYLTVEQFNDASVLRVSYLYD